VVTTLTALESVACVVITRHCRGRFERPNKIEVNGQGASTYKVDAGIIIVFMISTFIKIHVTEYFLLTMPAILVICYEVHAQPLHV
jgi:hypothetical protein